jgi:hypothetical protein
LASIGIGIGIVKTSAKLLVLVLVLLRRFPKVLVLVLGRNFGIAHLCLACCPPFSREKGVNRAMV